MFQQMGFGVAVALLIDATIIRSVVAAGDDDAARRWNWYLPRWLEWLPHIEVERAEAPSRQPVLPENDEGPREAALDPDTSLDW